MLGIDPTSAYAYLAMGILELIYRHDAAQAESSFNDALERGPGKPEVHRWYAALKIVTGEYGAALEHLDKARTFDPYHRMNTIFRASALYFAGRYEEAIVEARRYIDDAGENRLPYLIQSWSLIQLGRYEEAQANLLHCHELKGGNESLAYLGYVYAKMGRKKEAWRVLSQLSLSASGEYPSHVLRAIVYAGLGERDEVAAELEQALERKEPYLLWKLRDPVLTAIAADTEIRQQAALQSSK
jgi:tetratricopeptide (TPR) repeat protein